MNKQGQTNPNESTELIVDIESYYHSPIARQSLEAQGMYLNLKMLYLHVDCRLTIEESKTYLPEHFRELFIDLNLIKIVDGLIYIHEVDKQKADKETQSFNLQRIFNEQSKAKEIRNGATLGAKFWKELNNQ